MQPKGSVMRARFVLGFAALVLSTTSFACSSSSDTGTTQDSGITPQDTGTHDTATTTDSTPTDTGPQMCWIGHPTDTSAVQCDTCSFDKCKTQWTAAFGANYLSDDFTGGACQNDAKCYCACGEADATCKEACDISESSACRTAKQAIDDCNKSLCFDQCGIDNPDAGTETGGDAPSEGG